MGFSLKNGVCKNSWTWVSRLATVSLFGVITTIVADEQLDKFRKFAIEVLFIVQAGDREHSVQKLPDLFYYGVSSPDAGLEKAVEGMIEEIAKAAGINPVKATTFDKALFKVYVGREEDLRRLARREYSRELKLAGGAGYWRFYNANKVVTEAAVFLCGDVIRDDGRRRLNLLRTILGAFGFPTASSVYENSVFNGAAALQEVDRRLIEFVYKHVPAGSDEGDVRALARNWWPGN